MRTLLEAKIDLRRVNYKQEKGRKRVCTLYRKAVTKTSIHHRVSVPGWSTYGPASVNFFLQNSETRDKKHPLSQLVRQNYSQRG